MNHPRHTRHIILLFAALVTLTTSVKAETPNAIGDSLKTAFGKARDERVAVIGIGDSNQRFAGKGWSHYMAKALTTKFGAFGTGVNMLDSPKTALSAPAVFRTLAYSFMYMPLGESIRFNWNNGALFISSEMGLNPKSEWLCSLSYGTFTEGDSQLQLAVRKNQAPWTTILKGDKIITNTGANQLKTASITLPADESRDYPLMFSPLPVGTTLKGPYLGTYLHAEDAKKENGLSYQTLYAAGGQSLFDMLKTFKQHGEAALTSYFSAVRSTLNGDKTCVVMICSALNDRNEQSKSIGPQGGLKGDSPEAYCDNLRGITQQLEKSWINAGGSPKTIHFAFMPSHPVGEPDDAKLVAYRSEAVKLANELPNASCILLPRIVSHQTMVEKKYYDKGQKSSPHLSPAGYDNISKAVVEVISK